ncbi:hypothetical protein ACJMK2_026279 [Sinanodonta woodiana]|uniref:Uncharacterized protein n=1 Tax=Sinanodonta woodiana TaxID=1069815 RepID=A0ABD3XJK9_SINWO
MDVRPQHLTRLTCRDIYGYLVHTPYNYSAATMKPFKSQDIYVCFLSAKVTPSQRIKEKPHDPWVLGEVCSHVTSVLFQVKIGDRLGMTQTSSISQACKWNKSFRDETKQSFPPRIYSLTDDTFDGLPTEDERKAMDNVGKTMTRSQSVCLLWYRHRQSRITETKIHDVLTGFLINTEDLLLGVSGDGRAKFKCCGKGGKGDYLKENLTLKATHHYCTQGQLQMHVHQLQYSDSGVFTSNELFITRVKYDAVFRQKLVMACSFLCQWFYQKFSLENLKLMIITVYFNMCCIEILNSLPVTSTYMFLISLLPKMFSIFYMY